MDQSFDPDHPLRNPYLVASAAAFLLGLALCLVYLALATFGGGE